ncbi:MAG: hypothetical protein LVQ96_04195 [Thermoplasmatales archaeon]|nr:hypothetical protein [Thermoplasmatales archaeon]MCW6170355.1 hypothetical protein [Thermoplasmatales archaeon]
MVLILFFILSVLGLLGSNLITLTFPPKYLLRVSPHFTISSIPVVVAHVTHLTKYFIADLNPIYTDNMLTSHFV